MVQQFMSTILLLFTHNYIIIIYHPHPMATLYRHRVYCSTDSKYEYIWLDTETHPNNCPINTTHNINSALSSITERREQNIIRVMEEESPTGGNFKCETIVFNASASSTQTHEVQFLFDISILAVYMVTTNDQTGDQMEVIVAPETLIGVTTAPVSAGNTVISVSNTVIENIYKGYKVIITDGVNTDSLGYVISKDPVASTVTVQTAATHSFAAGSLVKISVYYVENYEFGPAWEYVIGESKIGASKLPANKIVRINYTNNGQAQKRIVIKLEYLY